VKMNGPRKSHILVVDDNMANIFALEQMLTKPGRGFIGATSGQEALKIALSRDIDIVLLDVQMPEMDGFEVAQLLKTNRRTKDVPILFVSAELKETQFVIKGFEEGAIDYLYKPLDPLITEAKVTALLEQYLSKKELTEKNAILEKYALLINNSADIICIIHAGTLKFEEANETVREILGYTPAEIKGTSLLYYLAREDRPMVQQLCRDKREKFSFDIHMYGKDRQERLLSWNVVHRNDWWFAHGRDVTGIKEVEEIKNYLAAAVKQSNEAIYLHDAEGRIISWNKGAEKIYGFTEEEALRMNIWNIVPEHLMAETQQVIDRILEGAEVRSVETRRITRQGKVIDVLFSASVLMGMNNNLQSIAITERDITDQKKAGEQIRLLNEDLQQNLTMLEKAVTEVRQVNRELESFSYSVSHDLRGPLRALNGYSQILEEEYGQEMNEEARKLLGNIRGNARRMGMLIDDLLAFSRMGRKEVQKTPVNMEVLVREVLEEIGNSMSHHAAIEVQDLPSVYADHALLRQVWVNLISNALKYSSKSPSPHVTIGWQEGEGGVFEYFVQDNGVGFNMEYANKLFGVFQRLHSDEEFEGTGVGLAIVQRIIARHGGKIRAKAAPGAGATFYFSLPGIVHHMSKTK